MNFKNRFFVFPADTSKARVGVFFSFRSGDWVYIDIYLYWWGVMINLWKWPDKETRKRHWYCIKHYFRRDLWWGTITGKKCWCGKPFWRILFLREC